MKRSHFLELIKRYLKTHPIVAILGPRQCGKTTLARQFCEENKEFSKQNYFDLESPVDMERLKNPMLALENLTGLIVIDEIQRYPNLFPLLRVLADKPNSNQKYLILGSASKALLNQSSESLAGRIAFLELTPFNLSEVKDIKNLWVRGGYPKSYLSQEDEESFDWRTFYIRTLLEQDIPNLGIQIPPESLHRFWTMLAHYHGNIFNASEIGRSFGASDVTMRRYLDILTGTFMIRQLQPWHANLGKRQVKSPKIYFRDSGLLHTLIRCHSLQDLLSHPKIGASWEGFALEEVLRAQTIHQDFYFWSTYGEAEIDLLLPSKNGLIGIEFKYCDAPKLTKSMKIASTDLNLIHLYVIYPGETDYSIHQNISVKSLSSYLNFIRNN
jgi:uncharacterized protein